MQTKPLGQKRWITHLLLASMLSVLDILVTSLFPAGKQGEILLILLGYLSLFLLGVTLLIGPLNLLRQRRNPVNIDLRRDVGIWAGITGCLHVLLVLRGSLPGNQILLYFLRRDQGGYAPLLSAYGLSNDAGLFATLFLLLLLALSNTLTLRLLKGKRWKWLQRSTYFLVLLALAHTFGFQYLNLRGPLWIGVVISLSMLVLVCQGWGIALMLARRKRARRVVEDYIVI
ncbi:MAG TPA: ferric reductase-like transmembrane domain-containing protein [Ktedonobacteraceae bacterium]|jgi:sulfoxide reductase heme-binding subunit YedZ